MRGQVGSLMGWVAAFLSLVLVIWCFFSYVKKTSGKSKLPADLPALHSAILSNEPDRVREFLEAGADVDALSKAGTPLHAALTIAQDTADDSERKIQEEIITLLLDHGANVNVLDQWGESPLNLAVTGRDSAFNLEMARKLIERGADVNAKGYAGTPLHTALAIGQNTPDDSEREIQEEIITLLLDHGANVNVPDQWGENTLNLAVTGRNLKFSVEMARKLIERGADVNAKNSSSLTPLHNVYMASEPMLPEDHPALLNFNANERLTAKESELPKDHTLLYDYFTGEKSPAQENRAPIVALLLASGADMHAQNDDGETPLFYALNDPESVKLLFDAGARIDVKNKKGKTPLNVAWKHRLAATELLSALIGK